MEDGFTGVFLSDRYVNYRPVGKELTPEEVAFLKALNIQQRVYENCLVRASVIGVSSALLGSLVGAFFFTFQASSVAHEVPSDKSAGIRSQLAAQYKQFLPAVKSSARNFAKLGFVYSLFECVIQKRRAKSDLSNALYAGCASGAFLGLKSGPLASAGGCIGFAAFSGLIEKYQQSHR
ncbi:mitochondrial import inner membrane translocase subunit [Babesia ovata]|uniref:Mitochondrial import inner membrane translocase subunit TIM22 n=1 Tax=Babesia ovata TaxID=189622 RepID=A0A2H6KA39_9APIC|nr:mitochondrial import inner membrane translocase subunit [Babesia ovata]GBE59856.1 mitochondrial import inner membrane translocase subunit [Babesia ovata]